MDEDLEFRDMVLKKLTESGSLLEIKAKLRALLYDVITKEQPSVDSTSESDISSSTVEKDTEAYLDGKTIAFELIMEMLESMNLHYTKQIFTVESGMQATEATHRNQLIRHLGLKMDEADGNEPQQPVLLSLIENARQNLVENSCDLGVSTNVSSDSKVGTSTSMEEDSGTQKRLLDE